MTELTHGASLTVIVAGDDDDSLAVRELALQWHADGLLGEFAWVRPSDLDREAYGPPTIYATVSGRESPVELMTYLGMRPRVLVRVVLLHLLTHEMSDVNTLVYTCDEIAELVNRSRPRTIDARGRHEGTQLLRINLMVPESDLHPQDPRIIMPAWEVNAVVSPEDRPELDRQSIFVRRAVNLRGHALNAAAAAGGLWSTSETGAFDTHESDSTTGGGEVVVVRCQARLVVGDDRSDELAESVITQLQESPIGAAAWVSWAAPSDNAPAVVHASTERLMTHPEWAPLEREAMPLRKRQVPLGEAISEWAVFQLRLVPAVAHFLFGWGRSMVERSVTALTVGRDAGDEGKVRPLPPEKVEEVAELRMRDVEDRLRPTLLEEEAASWGQATPGAWRELRELAIGLVDGSRLPEGFSRATRGGADEVVPPGSVVADPADVYELETGMRIGPVDVEKAELAVADIEEYRRAVAAAPPAANEGRRRAVSSDDEPAPDSGEPVEPERDVFTPFFDWLEQRQTTLLWQVAARVLDLKRLERERAAQAQQAIADAEPPTTEKLESTKQFLVVTWGIALAALGAVLVLTLLSMLEDPAGVVTAVPDIDWFDVVRVVLVAGVILLTAGTMYFQAMRSYEWAVTRRMHTLQQAGDDYVAARHQERRWELMHTGIVDWARILGELLHRPWTAPQVQQPEVPEHTGLPASVAVAVHLLSEKRHDARVVAHAIEHVCQKGWLAEEFDRVVTASPKNTPGRSVRLEGGDLPADLDLGIRLTGPRRELAELAAQESTKQTATECLLEDVTRLLHSGDMRVPPHTVVRLGFHSAGETMLDRDFLTPRPHVAPFVTELFTPEGQLAQFQVPERTVLCLPEGIEPPSSLASALQTEVHGTTGTTAIRVDVSPLISHDNIALFQRVLRREYHPTTTPDDFN